MIGLGLEAGRWPRVACSSSVWLVAFQEAGRFRHSFPPAAIWRLLPAPPPACLPPLACLPAPPAPPARPACLPAETYMRTIVPIGFLYAGTLWLGNAAYIHLSVSFIQMLKASPLDVQALRLLRLCRWPYCCRLYCWPYCWSYCRRKGPVPLLAGLRC